MERSQNSFCVCVAQTQICVCVCEGTHIRSQNSYHRPTQNDIRDWSLGGIIYLGIFRCKMPWSCRFLLLCLALRHSKNKKRARIKHSRYRKDFFKSLSIEERRRRYRKIPRCALIPLALSPWRRLLHSQNDQAFITMTGFDCDSFDSLLVKFGPMFDGHTPFDESGMIVEFEYVTGRKREVQSADCLGLALIWTHTRGPLNVLQLVLDSPLLTFPYT